LSNSHSHYVGDGLGFAANQDVAVRQLEDPVAITLCNFSISCRSAELSLIESMPG